MKVMPLLVLVLLSACAPKSELDEANKKIAELQAQAAASQAETAKIRAEAEAAKNTNQNLEAQNSQLQAKVDEKPELPVTLSFRKAIMEPGYVAIFNTTIKAPVAVLVNLHSAALGTTKQIELHLDSTHPTELGRMEGAVIENGDTITIENQNYSPISFTVSN
jgi:predicted nuclease with TOPRIM domain